MVRWPWQWLVAKNLLGFVILGIIGFDIETGDIDNKIRREKVETGEKPNFII